MDDILQTEIAGTTLAEIVTLEFLLGALGSVALALVILIVGLWLGRVLRGRIIRAADASERFDRTIGRFLGNIARYGVLALTFIFVLNAFGVTTTSLVALVGAAGLAIGLALQGVLGGLASGVMLIVMRPIRIGDFIQVGEHAGTVKDISLFTTELSTVGNVQVILPNTEVWGKPIANYSAYPDRQAEWTFGVGYGADLKRAEQVIRKTVMADPRSRAEPEPFIQVNNLGDFSVDFLVRVWCAAADYWQYQADMRRAVKEALDEAGVPIPFPTRTVQVEERRLAAPPADGAA